MRDYGARAERGFPAVLGLRRHAGRRPVPACLERTPPIPGAARADRTAPRRGFAPTASRPKRRPAGDHRTIGPATRWPHRRASQPTAGRNQHERFRTARQFVPADVERIDLPPDAEPAVELGELTRSQERLRQPPGLGRPACWKRFGGTRGGRQLGKQPRQPSGVERRRVIRLGSPEVRTQTTPPYRPFAAQ